MKIPPRTPRRRTLRDLPFGLVTVAIVSITASADGWAAIRVSPAAVKLHGPDALQQVIVWETSPDGRTADVTREVGFEMRNGEIATIDRLGLISPLGEGETEVVVRHRTEIARVAVVVDRLAEPNGVSFEQQIIPLLTKSGCNAGSCHGKAEGQNGFKLSVFGFDPQADFKALVMEGRGRRVFPAAPDHSLLLLKATNQIPHGGGQRIEPNSRRYQLFRRWIAEGAALGAGKSANVIGIEVEPREPVLNAGQTQQLRVTATFSDGSRRCVTVDAEYSSNAEPIAGCDARGLVKAGSVAGEAAILVRVYEQRGHGASHAASTARTF